MFPWILLGVLGSILLLLAFLLFLKFKITVGYREEVTLRVGVSFLNIKILPRKKKKTGGPRSMSAAKAKRIRKRIAKKAERKAARKREKELRKQQKKTPSEQSQKEKKTPSASEIVDLLDMVRKLIYAIVRRFCKHLRVDVARIKLKIATGDAATTAVAYGAVTQAINVLLPILQSVKNFGLPKTTQFDIQPDFLAESSEMDIEISFSIRTWQILHVWWDALLSLIKHKLSRM